MYETSCHWVDLIQIFICNLGCNAILNRHNGTLTSPAFGHANYPHNQKCTYKIRHPEGGKLSMIFSYLDVHPTDSVQVRQSFINIACSLSP